MEWWNQLNNYAALMPQSPALALHWAVQGPQADTLGYDLASLIQQTPAQLDVYPSATPGG